MEPNALYSHSSSSLQQDQSSLHLHHEIELLKRELRSKEYQMLQMEARLVEAAEKYPLGEAAAAQEECERWKLKYDRLLDSHRRLIRVNQSLEDKLLRLVDHGQSQKALLSSDIFQLSQRLSIAQNTIAKLESEVERYRTDCTLATHLLQCKPQSFMSHRIDELPTEFQEKARTLAEKKKAERAPEPKTIRVPISTFPPTAMVFSVERPDSGNGTRTSSKPDLVSAAIMAKVLEEREKERHLKVHCETCQCTQRGSKRDKRDASIQVSLASLPPDRNLLFHPPTSNPPQLVYVRPQRSERRLSSQDGDGDAAGTMPPVHRPRSEPDELWNLKPAILKMETEIL